MKDIKNFMVNEANRSYAGNEDIINNIEKNCEDKILIEMCKDLASRSDKPISGLRLLELIDQLIEYINKK